MPQYIESRALNFIDLIVDAADYSASRERISFKFTVDFSSWKKSAVNVV